MEEARSTSHMAIFVLMAILLTAVTTTATPHQSPDHAVKGRDVPDNATEDRVSRRQSAAESHHGGHHRHVAEEDSERPLQNESRALGNIQKRSAEYICIEIRTSLLNWAGTDGDVYVSLTGENGERTHFYNIDDPNANDFERGDRKKYWWWAKYVGETITKLSMMLTESGLDPEWKVSFMRVLYRKECYFFNFEHWIEDFDYVYDKYPVKGCQW